MVRSGDSDGLKNCWEDDERDLYAAASPKVPNDAEDEDGEDEHELEQEDDPTAQQAVSELICVVRRECKCLTENCKNLPVAKAKELKGLISSHVLALRRAAKRAEKNRA